MEVDETQTCLLQALTALRDDRIDDADRLAQRLLAQVPNSPSVLQLAAAIAYRRGWFAEAERLALACLAAQPDHVPALLIAGRAARAAEQPERAATLFAQAIKLAPNDPEPAFQYGLTQIALGIAAADEAIRALESRFPDHGEGWGAMGAALRGAERHEAALAAFLRAAAGSSHPRYAVEMATTLLKLSRPQEAIRVLRKVLVASPEFAPAMEALARALRSAGDLAGAKAMLLQLTAAKPNEAVGFFLMGLVCEDMRDDDGAIAAFRRCAELQPQASEAHVNLGIALQRSGELDAARESYRRAMNLRADTFARIAQALPAAAKGELWLDLAKLRRSLS